MTTDDSSTMRLFVATDNHLGVWEEDAVRKDDSFTAFEEILQHATRMKADALLLGGDLFHENKPSRCVKAARLFSLFDAIASYQAYRRAHHRAAPEVLHERQPGPHPGSIRPGCQLFTVGQRIQFAGLF